MVIKHDQLLLLDLKLQPLWLLWLYLLAGAVAAAVALFQRGAAVETALGVGGGFLVALGAEKLVIGRICSAALRCVVRHG